MKFYQPPPAPSNAMPRIFSVERLGKNRVEGFYETPLNTVEYICSKVIDFYQPGMKIIDPCVGDGIFLYALESAGVRKEDLYGYDIDEEKINKLKEDFPNVCLFDATYEFPEKFDIMVGNPPYNGDESHYIREHRERLKKTFKEIKPKNTFSLISYRCFEALKEGGMFSMILLDSFMTNTYYQDFRKVLLRDCEIEEMLLAPRKLFYKISADVRTCILTCRKKGPNSKDPDVRLVDRVESEEEYWEPKKVEIVKQSSFDKYPNSTFLVGIPDSIRELYVDAEVRLKDIVLGGTGISTGKDAVFLRKREEVIDDPEWVPYYKNGSRNAYHYVPKYHIHRDYRKSMEVSKDMKSNYLIRNKKYFFREGITCSSVGVRFTASYMPEGGLFGVNANFFFDEKETMYYTLAFLNTRLAWYFCRNVVIRTNNISANYLRLLPYIEPDTATKTQIAKKTKTLVQQLQKNEGFDYKELQTELDNQFLAIYGIKPEGVEAINEFCNNFYDKM